ncbi:MAG: Plug domain-containing protein [Algibacter sp.]
MKKSILFCILSLILVSFTLFNKSYFKELVDEKLDKYALENTPEKIYIHTDKPYYALDENIWYTGYLVNGITHEKSSKSWVFYVELVDGDNKIVAKKKLFTNNISVAGDFKIGKDWETGNYLLRAYTNYMKNDNLDYFFQKEITILGSKNNDSLKKTINPSNIKTENVAVIKPDLNFYPEGGYLIENIRSKIAIKIKNDVYKNAELSGTIIDDQQNVISDFNTTEFGLGVFSLNPKPNKTYSAILEVNGVEYSYKLPKALSNGLALSLVNLGDHLVIDVKSTTKNALNETYLVVHQRGKLIYSKYETEDKKTYSVKLPVKELKDGVIQVTLFDTYGNPVCERLVFISNPKNKTIVEITKDKAVLSKRKQIKINVNVKDNEGQNLPSHLSMSVRDLSAFPHNNRSKNIKTWLLLNSDLRGEIEDPGYFFEKEGDYKRRYLLDLIMLTHGWRRFTWPNLLYSNEKANKILPEKGITISGTTKFLKKPYSATQTETRLSFFGNPITQEPIQKTDTQGRFSYGPFIFFDSVQAIVESRLTNFKSKEETDRELLILLNQDTNSPEINRNIISKNEIDNEKQLANFLKMSEYIKQINFEFDQKTQRLEEVTILAKKEEELSHREQEMNDRTDHGYASTRIDLEGDYNYSGESIFNLLSTIVGVTAYNDTITIRGGGIPTILLDNFPIDIDFLSTLDATEISFIDVLKGADAAIYANSGSGVIALYTKTGNINSSRNVKRKPGIIDFSAQGFYTARTFYAPDHINGFEEQTKADIRTTLHWEPIIRITENGGQDISFFSSDSESDYLIEIEGLSESGIPLHAISTFSVN